MPSTEFQVVPQAVSQSVSTDSASVVLPRNSSIERNTEDIGRDSGSSRKTEDGRKNVYNKLAELTESLGYELLDENKIQVSREYFDNVSKTRRDEDKTIKQLLSLENGAILSELYNTYKNLYCTSLDNIEAVMANFFSKLFLLGYEVDEEDYTLGEKLIVNTEDLFKDFVFSKPVEKDGDVFAEVQYLSWKYKNKTIMPKVVTPLEEVIS